MIINESNRLNIEPDDILVDKRSKVKYKVVKPYDGYITAKRLDSPHVSMIKNDALTDQNYFIERR